MIYLIFTAASAVLIGVVCLGIPMLVARILNGGKEEHRMA